jgi:Putative zinc-finger domain
LTRSQLALRCGLQCYTACVVASYHLNATLQWFSRERERATADDYCIAKCLFVITLLRCIQVWEAVGGVPISAVQGLPVAYFLPAGLMLSTTTAAATAAQQLLRADNSANSSADDDSAQSDRLDPMVMLCPFELDGKCNDYECAYQHLQGGRRAAPLCVPLPKLQLPGYSAIATAQNTALQQQQQRQQTGNVSAIAAEAQADSLAAAPGAGSVQVSSSKAKRTRDAAAAASADNGSTAAAQGESQQQQQQASKRRKAASSPSTISPATTPGAATVNIESDVGFVDASDDAEQHADTSSSSSSAEAESAAAWLAQFAAAASSLHTGHRAAAAAQPYAAFTSDSDGDSTAALQELNAQQVAKLRKCLKAEPGNCAAWLLLALHKLPCPAPRSSTSSSTKMSSSSVSAGGEQSNVLLATDRLYYLEKLLRRNSKQQQQQQQQQKAGSSSGTSSLKPALVALSSALTHVPNRLHYGLWLLYLKLMVLHGSGNQVPALTEHAGSKLPTSLPLWQFTRTHGAAAASSGATTAAAAAASGAVVAVSDVAALCLKRLGELCALLALHKEQKVDSKVDESSVHKMLVYVLLDRTQLLVSVLYYRAHLRMLLATMLAAPRV